MIIVKLRKSIASILLVVMVFVFSGCSNKDKETLNSDLKNAGQINTINNLLKTPDTINMYVDGKQKQVRKNGDKYEQTLFERINFLIDIRIPSEFFVLLGHIQGMILKM